MAQVSDRTGTDPELHASLLAVMRDLSLPAPDRMLNRIESMLPSKDRERVLRQILEDFRQQSPEEMKRILKVLAPNKDEWIREVETFIAAWRTA